jgi:predicted branched-subunit amino acid permease
MAADRSVPAGDLCVSGRLRLFGGLRLGFSLAAGSFLLAIGFGALARSSGWGAAITISASAVVFSGSAQYTLAAVLASGGIAPAVVAAALINARFLPMALAVAPALHGGRLRRALEAQAVVDASWAAAHLGQGRFDRERLIGATIPQWPAWVAGTAIGAIAAPPADLVSSLGLDVVFPAFFVVLLIDELHSSRRACVVAAASTGLAALSTLALPAGLAVLASSPAALLGIPDPLRRPAR